MHHFIALDLEGKPVLHMNAWQFRHFPLGPQLTNADVDHILKYGYNISTTAA
jgi:hypothetical protein